MAGLGFDLDDFDLFDIDDPDERSEALEREIQPKLQVLGEEVVGGLGRTTGQDLHLHAGKTARKKGAPLEEVFVAFSNSPKGYRAVPYLAIAVSREHVHARVGARAESDRKGVMRKALEREAANLAKKGKPFRKLRPYMGWNHEELPELAPAHSAAFWEEMGEALAGTGVELGIAWTKQEARSMAVGDVLGAFRDLSPLYKLLVNAE